MNDPGLDRPITDASHQVDGATVDTTDEEEEEKAYLDPSRRWFASTACPLIAGTVGPLANAFSICALGSYWRQTTVLGSDQGSPTFIPDPHWLIAVNAVSLAAALVANAFLLFNMAGRVKFILAQPITILGFTIAAVLLVGLLAAASRQSFIGPSADHAFTQAFYYAIWAAVIYIIVAALMILTVIGALRGKYPKEFNLTPSQRTLMLQTISFITYLLIGALVFSVVEGWHYLDSVYWADFTLLTIGIGTPLTPNTHAGRALLIPYAIGGIVTVGLIVGSIRSMLLETGKHKLRARTTEKTRSRVHSFMDVRMHRPGLSSLSTKSSKRKDMLLESARRRDFYAMRKIQERAITKSKWLSLLLSTCASLILWYIGALVFQHAEHEQGWSYFVSLYFSYTTLLTIGYGDYQPTSNSGRAFFVLWSLLAVPTLTILISDMGDTVVQAIADITDRIGSLTILPQGTGITLAWSQIVVSAKALMHSRQGLTDGELSSSTQRPGFEDINTRLDFESMLRRRLGQSGINHCLSFVSMAEQAQVTQDQFLYRWILVREIQSLWMDTQVPQSKKYSYEEWSYFLRLLGHDEQKPELQRRSNQRPKRGPDDEPQIGKPIDKFGKIRPWSWMGIRSPLMSPKDESSWILQELIAKMQRELDNQAFTPQSQGKCPPVSSDMLDVNSDASHKSESRGPSQQQV